MSEGEKDRRIKDRMRLSLPVRVTCREPGGGDWTEQSRVIDLTPFGASFALSRPVDVGRLLHLQLPMPRQLRCFDHIEDQYRVYALVRRIKLGGTNPEGRQLFEMGVAFVGKRPPASYELDPSTRYEIEAGRATGEMWKAHETGGRRGFVESRETRLTMPVDVMVEALDEHGAITESEQTVTENISRRGAAVFTTLKIERGRFVRLRSARFELAVLAVVRGRRKGPDNIDRLHLEFIDRPWPLEILE